MTKPKTTSPKPKSPKTSSVSTKKNTNPGTALFPIVGIGASAGGLEALEQFLSHVPENSGLGYVVIQHLDPTQKGMLPELLQRVSKMKVYQAKDRMVVKPNCVYVIPPNKSMSILNGALHLFKPIEIRGLRLPVDFFLRSLAEDLKELSVGIILSGMGSDGSEGMRAIKEKNGVVMVQEPTTAKFDSMPRNAINSVLVDIIAPADKLFEELSAFLKSIPPLKHDLVLESKDISAIEKIIILLRTHTGNDFSLYKKNTLYRRIERRMGIHKVNKITSYINFLQENPKEVDILFKELLIGVTSFFRDANVWEKLKNVVLQDNIVKQHADSHLRAWVAGCSTGEEAYSLAIIFKEALDEINPKKNITLQIFATDLDNDAIEVARKGVYNDNIGADVSPERLSRFFVKTDDGYRVSNEIREMVVFAQHNMIMHPPFTKMDIVACRNVLIYLSNELQKKILKLFYYSMKNDGVLILGNSETLGMLNHLFKPIDIKLKIYKPAVNALVSDLGNFPSSFLSNKPDQTEKDLPAAPVQNIQTHADQFILKHFSPPSVLVNENGDIIYFSGRTGKYLEPAAGKANLNIFAMLREGLRAEFHLAFHQALGQREPVILRNLKVGTNGSTQTVNITIQKIEIPESLKGAIFIVFNDIPDIPAYTSDSTTKTKDVTNPKGLEFEKQLQKAREEKQSLIEEMQASHEELKSANEELQSSNEELQSTNEELTSSKEEMQSLNEELQTVNAELQIKIDDFMRVDNDMKNLLNSTNVATLFLDKDLKIRRFTNQATKIFKFIKSDIGRPFTDQVSELIYPEMANDALEVLETLVLKEKQIPGKKGQWFSIRIMPYRTFDDRIDGLVITFINITELKRVEEKLDQTEQLQRLLLSTSNHVIIKLSTDWIILEFNTEAERFFGIKRKEALDKNYLDLIIPKAFRVEAQKALQKILNNQKDGKLKLQVTDAIGEMPVVEFTHRVLINKMNKATGMILMTNNQNLNY
jgi:two-component system, chemotaxis family, CheB/CheR fusion protein